MFCLLVCISHRLHNIVINEPFYHSLRVVLRGLPFQGLDQNNLWSHFRCFICSQHLAMSGDVFGCWDWGGDGLHMLLASSG